VSLNVGAGARDGVALAVRDALLDEGTEPPQRAGDRGGDPLGERLERDAEVGSGRRTPVTGMYASPKPIFGW